MTDPPDRDEEPGSLADHLREYLREPMLWPVTAVAVAIFLTMGVAGLTAALGQRNLFAMAAMALLAGMSVDQVVRELRRGGAGWVTGLVAAFWIASGAGAFLLLRM